MAPFDELSDKFNRGISEFVSDSADVRSWSLLDLRQFEIMDSMVDNGKKAEAFDRVLLEIRRIHPHANTYYCRALEKRLSVTDRKNVADLERIAKDAYIHKRDVDLMLYGKIIYGVYQFSKDKEHFPFRRIALSYRKKQLAEDNKLEREHREDDLRRIDYDLEDPFYDSVQKLNKVEDALTLLKEEKYFGPVQANEAKYNYCMAAVKICREELNDTDTANFYLAKSKDYSRRADNARRKWAQRRGLWTNAQEQAYLQKYRTDGRE